MHIEKRQISPAFFEVLVNQEGLLISRIKQRDEFFIFEGRVNLREVNTTGVITRKDSGLNYANTNRPFG